MKHAIPLILLLSACANSPMPGGLAYAQKQDVTAHGRAYTVWWTDTAVEVIRHGWANPGEHQAIRNDMIDLIPQVTGCTATEGSLTGDSGEMRSQITCP